MNEKLIDFTDVLTTLVEVAGGSLPKDKRLDGQSFFGQMLGQSDAPERDWIFAGNLPRAAIRGHDYLLGADDRMYDIRENPYRPKLLAKTDFSPEQQSQYTRLRAAMDALDHPYKQGPIVARGKKKK